MRASFDIQERDGVPSVVFATGTNRQATPEEVELWKLIDVGCPRTEVENPSLLGWYLYFRMGTISISELDPKWISRCVRDFMKLGPVKILQQLRSEFPDDDSFRKAVQADHAKGVTCRG